MDPATQQLLDGAWDALSGAPAPVEIVGVRRGLLPSRLAALPAATASVAAATLAAAELAGCGGAVVDPAHVSLAVRSERYASQVGTEGPDPFGPLSRFWRTADGWLRLHANYPWHKQRALAVLGCSEEPASVEAAVGEWPGESLETAIAEAGGAASFVRSPERWAVHPQGFAVAGQPLLDIRSGPADPRPSASTQGDGPAGGVRVLDLTRVIAGPVATRMLAAYGADVLRVDPPFLPELSTVDTLSGKRSTLLDLCDRTDRARFDELLEAADIVVHGYRPGALQALGFSTSHQVVVALSAWGPLGPWASRRGFDSLVQAATGIATLTGEGEAPGVLPAQVLDHATGYLAAAAAMLGLAELRRGNGTSSTTLSLAQTSHWLQSAGLEAVSAAEAPDPGPYLVGLPSTQGVVTVVAPPGRIDAWTPSWSRTTTLGADAPTW
jgi:hypothetical protein